MAKVVSILCFGVLFLINLILSVKCSLQIAGGDL